MLEIAWFLSSISSYNTEMDKFEIKGMVGSDEFHTAYLDSSNQDK